MELEGKTAIVTGGARNIGRATALALAADGADVVVNAVQDAEAAEVSGGLLVGFDSDVGAVEDAKLQRQPATHGGGEEGDDQGGGENRPVNLHEPGARVFVAE